MLPIKKFKLVSLALVLCYIIYNLFADTSVSGDNLMNNISSNSNPARQTNAANKSSSYDDSVFSVNYLAQQFKAKFNSDALNHKIESAQLGYLAANNLAPASQVNPNLHNFSINFDDGGSATSFPANHSNNDSPTDKPSVLVINDLSYMKNSTQSTGSNSSSGEKIFVTDGASNTLLSCASMAESYGCHVAVSNLNDPQDMLVIQNNIYLINSHPYRESGDITKCHINSTGYIDSCSTQPLAMINPAFFYYNPPTVYISTFVWSGDGKLKPDTVFACNIGNDGNFTNCNLDYDVLSMSFIAKGYNNSFYRPHSYPAPSSIEKCATVDATFCTPMYNKALVYPLSVSINHDRIFITNQKSNNVPGEILKCSMDLKTCSVVTDTIAAPKCIGVFNFQGSRNKN